jgi:hypothetical protein
MTRPEVHKVTWAMDGKNSFVAKAMHLVMDFDELVGKDFERGLHAMKTIAEEANKTNVAKAAK